MITRTGLPALLLLLGAVPGLADPPARRPNILILLTDDQGYGDFSCHGNPVLRTPHLDRLHSESVRFTDFHSAPMCTPTRGQLLTGVDAVRNGATSVTAGRSFLRPGLPTLPEIFAAAGYRTGIFGKWHLGDSAPHRPTDRGFQEAVWHRGWGFTSAPEMTNTLSDGRYVQRTEERRFVGYCTDFWFERAIGWMRECAAAGEPFVAYLPTNAPHAPHDVPDRYAEPYRGRGPEKFFGMIANVDENVGRLEAFLASSGLRNDTIVVFATDNGGTAGVRVHNAGMRGHKTELYEGGHRVPCFVRWPAGGLRPPGDVDVPAQMQDLLPTLIELADVRAPAGAAFDGRSLAGLLRGSREPFPDRTLVVQYGQEIVKGQACVIRGKWRLVKGTELYDLARDPGQENDLAQRESAMLTLLKEQYDRWWAGVEPRIASFVPISLGAAAENPVTLTSSDWEGVYADNSRHVGAAAGGPRGGPWNVFVEAEGDYELTLRRWPEETRLALDSGGIGGVALPVAAGRAEIAGRSLRAPADRGARELVLLAKLPRGRTQLRAWFQDASGADLAGAHFVTVRKL